MNSAYADFMGALASLREEADVLPSLTINQLSNNRSAAHLRLNGLSVVAFSTLEDFVRRRTLEVVKWLGDQGVPFSTLPIGLQTLILTGTIKGLYFFLDRTERQKLPLDKSLVVQLEGMALSQTGENGKFVPSEFFFGRNSSNISLGSIRELFQAAGFSNVENVIDQIGKQFRLSIQANIFLLFGDLAQKRHSSAHTFPLDYRSADFVEDVKRRLPIFAACFDACLSQYAYLHVRDYSADNLMQFDQARFFGKSGAMFRVVEWDPEKKEWQEFLNGHFAASLSGKGKIEKRKLDFREGKYGRGNSILWMNEKGLIVEWNGPVP